MKTITQKKVGTRNMYYRTTTDSAGIPIKNELFDCRIIVKRENGKRLIILLDRFGNIRRDAYRYLNETCIDKKYTTRRQIATALNLLYIFLDIMEYPIQNLSKAHIGELMNFLLGVTVRNAPFSSPRTIRKAETVNGYYAFIKAFIEDCGYDTSAFSERVSYCLPTTIGDITCVRNYKRDPNRLKTDTWKQKVAPKHLNKEQANALINLIKENNDIQTYINVNLQMGHGLRKGEMLGITREDLKEDIDAKTGKPRNYIILRNRCSDRDDQHCKTLIHPADVSVYSQESYQNALSWVVPISKYLYDLIIDFDNKNRNRRMSAERRRRMIEDTRADSVEGGGKTPYDQNHYIFTTKAGRRLSGQTYNNWLKKYFVAIGVPVDRGIKTSNCSHRLRHTFAMFLTQYSPKPVSREQLRIALRHSSILSGEAYYTPTEEETLSLKEEFVDEIYELIPGLKSMKP